MLPASVWGGGSLKAHPKFQDGNGEKVTKQQRDREEISSRDVGREKGEMRRGFINHQPGDWQPHKLLS